ncbi:natural cytotoxicity triggering receptor 3 ligand 1 isoform X2 [Pan paniscus]|uniref:natural cytotoxicity triggering receptor 3 ligand 1 isoform X2 n=1 Tax=Pan paniscus TaxID=9597 RepID=UPI0024372D32|nr:natural cytotoxicity triggering receptor 3 ligand 1 isoform X2 [Pan paniscus]
MPRVLDRKAARERHRGCNRATSCRGRRRGRIPRPVPAPGLKCGAGGACHAPGFLQCEPGKSRRLCSCRRDLKKWDVQKRRLEIPAVSPSTLYATEVSPCPWFLPGRLLPLGEKKNTTAAAAMAWRAAASTCAALLILLWALTTAGDLKVEMMAGGTQITPLNDNVTIFCNIFYSQPLNITSMGITWFWKSLTFDKEVKVFEFFGDHQEAFRPGAIVSPWRLKSGDASLRLPGIQLEEAGEYRCEVVVTPLKAQGTVQLEVVASPASRLFLDQVGVKENEGKYMCESSGFYPEAINITWEKQTQKFPHPIEISEDVITGPTIKNMDGTFNVTSCLKLNSSQEDPGTVYQCVVRHASLHTPLRSNFTLTAARHSLSETEKTDNFSIHWWPISFTGVGLVLLIVLIPWKKICNKSS